MIINSSIKYKQYYRYKPRSLIVNSRKYLLSGENDCIPWLWWAGWEYIVIVDIDYDDDDAYVGSKNITVEVSKQEQKDPYLRRILVVDDEPDLTLTFKAGLEQCHCDGKRKFEVYAYNNPLQVLTEFKPAFYDLMLIDVYMPGMSGFQLCEKILEIDANLRVCFISAAELNIQALREVYPKLGFGCFIKKPVEMQFLVERLCVELDWSQCTAVRPLLKTKLAC